MANEIRVAVCASQLEVSVVGVQPCVDYVRDGDAGVSNDQRAWGLLAAVAGVALDTDGEEPFVFQLIAFRGKAKLLDRTLRALCEIAAGLR